MVHTGNVAGEGSRHGAGDGVPAQEGIYHVWESQGSYLRVSSCRLAAQCSTSRCGTESRIRWQSTLELGFRLAHGGPRSRARSKGFGTRGRCWTSCGSRWRRQGTQCRSGWICCRWGTADRSKRLGISNREDTDQYQGVHTDACGRPGRARPAGVRGATC